MNNELQITINEERAMSDKNRKSNSKTILYYLLFVLFFILNNVSYALINDSLLKKSNKIMINQPDSSKSLEKEKIDTNHIYVPLSQFIYAGDRRYTLDGSLPLQKTNIKPLTTAIVGAVFAAAIIGMHINQTNAWWSGQGPKKFHFLEDWAYCLQVDKAGHAYGGYMTSYAMSEVLIASGFSWDAATIWGSAFGLGYETIIEIEDGYARDWGFCPSDWYFDALGAIFFLGQHYTSALQNLTPKWSYIPSEWSGRPKMLRPRTFIDDYNSSTFWLSIDVHNILPDNLKKYWVPWLNLAVGYGGVGIDANTDPTGPPDQLSYGRFIVSLDYNLVRLLPEGWWLWNWFRQSLNLIKLPSPSIEFTSHGTRFSLLYPFRINIGNVKF